MFITKTLKLEEAKFTLLKKIQFDFIHPFFHYAGKFSASRQPVLWKYTRAPLQVSIWVQYVMIEYEL